MDIDGPDAMAPSARRGWLKWAGGAGLSAALPGVASATATAASRSRFPNLPVVTHEGRTLRFYEDLVRGRIVVVNMMYTACSGVCPVGTANLLQVQEALGPRLGRDVFMYSMTFQPQFDDARALRDFMRRYGVKPGWTFLTGQQSNIEQLRRALGFFNTDPAVDADPRAHTGMVRAGNDARNRWLMVPAIGSPARILSAVQRL